MHITSARVDIEIVLCHTFGRIIKYQRFSLIIVVKDVRPYLGDTSRYIFPMQMCGDRQ